jgi:curved DNA-binding protein
MKYIDYYEVLGVPKTTTEKEIKQAYRNLARKHHPDLHQGDAKAEAEEKFKLINEAYEVLGDADKRAKYDKLGMNWKAGDELNFDPANTGGFTYTYQGPSDFDLSGFGFSDFFSHIFGQDFARSHQGGGRTRRYDFKGEDIDAEISLSVEELLHGVEKDLYLSAPNVCSACEGERFTRLGACRACGGTGITEDTKTVKVKVPAGLHPGATLRLKGLGGKGFGSGPAGDLYLHIRAAQAPGWQVTGSDLETDLMIYPDQAIIGDKVQVPTPHGQVQLKIQPGIHAGQKLRLKNKGLPRSDGSFGDLYFKIRIDIPQKEQELYRQIREIRQSGENIYHTSNDGR